MSKFEGEISYPKSGACVLANLYCNNCNFTFYIILNYIFEIVGISLTAVYFVMQIDILLFCFECMRGMGDTHYSNNLFLL